MQCERVGRPASLGAITLALHLPIYQANTLQVLYLFKSRYVARIPVERPLKRVLLLPTPFAQQAFGGQDWQHKPES